MRAFVWLFAFMLVAGCGVQSSSFSTDSASIRDAEMKSEPPILSKYGQESAGESFSESEKSTNGRPAVAKGQIDSAERKIIYTATIDLVVSQFDGLEKKIQDTIKQCNGYVARVNLDRMQGEHRTGSWTARIPTDKYNEFLESIADLGVPVSQEQDAQDVTEEFVDLTARIANQKKLEKRILELLDRPDDKIQHVIEVERELGRVRETIERMEGRIRFLSDQTEMTTVIINAREERDYQPPQAPSLNNRVASAWTTSIANTRTALGNILVNFVGSLIPIMIGIVLFLAFWFLIGRRLWKLLIAMVSKTGTNVELDDDDAVTVISD